MSTNPQAIQDIEALKQRHKKLERDKVTAEANCKTAEEQLQKLKDQAREKYQTDDLDKLKQLLQKMKQENDQKRLEYQKHLDEIEAKVQAIEKQYQA